MATIPHHNNLLLDNLYVIALLQLDDFDGRQFIALDSLRLQSTTKPITELYDDIAINRFLLLLPIS